MFKPASQLSALIASLSLLAASSQAGAIYLPNGSFENPVVPQVSPYAGPDTAGWQKTAQPVWYDGSQFPWDQLTGQFYNVPFPGQFIDNAEGNQAAFLFALPGVGLFQDYNSLSGTNTLPGHEFNAQFNVGHSYTLTVGIIGGGGGMSNGVPIQISLYYRDAQSNLVTVASTSITNSTALFPTNTHLVDFQAHLPTVFSTNAWAGKNIGVQILSTVGFDLLGGYWDVDNVRLTEEIEVPNGSFENPVVSPVSPYAGPDTAEWQKTPQPFWYEGSQFPWDQLTGQFYNVPFPGQFIDNADGNQAAFLFALPGVGLFQDYDSIYGTNSTPDHAFNVKFTPGKAYKLTVGLIGGGGGMSNGTPFQIALYYRDAFSNQVTVASVTATNSTAIFPTNTHLVDFSATIAGVLPNDAWAGKNIGIALTSTVDFSLVGGYWDLDNVRLQETVAPMLLNPQYAGGLASFTVQSEPGLRFDLLTSTNAALPLTNWTALATITNTTGSLRFTDTQSTNSPRRYYRAKQL